MRHRIGTADRIHMLVWRSPKTFGWCAARAMNGAQIDYARWFATWRDAMDYALREAI